MNSDSISLFMKGLNIIHVYYCVSPCSLGKIAKYPCHGATGSKYQLYPFFALISEKEPEDAPCDDACGAN